MSDLSDEYIKNFTTERKKEFNRRFRDDYDAAMSERSNIIRILNEMRELGLANGGLSNVKIFPRVNVVTGSEPLAPGIDLKKRDLNYGITGLLQGDKFFGGAEIDKGKVKFDIVDQEGNTFFKDTISKDDAVNFILGMGDPKGDKVQIKTDKDFENMQVIFRSKFKGGGITRVPFQDGANEMLKDLIDKAVGKFDQVTGIDQIGDFEGSMSSATGAPSDFRHRAASNLLAETLGKKDFLGPVGYVTGGLGSFGLGTIKEIGDLISGIMDKNTTTKQAFSQALEDTISNFKGAFAPAGTTTQDLYDKIMKDYVPEPMFTFAGGIPQQAKILANRRFRRRNSNINPIAKDRIKTRPISGTTKPGTGGGGGFTPTTTAQNMARTTSRVEDGRVKAYGLAEGGLALMLGE